MPERFVAPRQSFETNQLTFDIYLYTTLIGIPYINHHSMPKEQIRKRGRRKPKEEEFAKPKVETATAPDVQAPASTQVVDSSSAPPQAGPSGLHPDRIALLNTGRRPAPPPRAPNEGNAEGQKPGEGETGGDGDQPQQPWGRVFGLNEEFPFGELDPDLKGYFKTVEDQIKDWEGTSSAGEQREGTSQVFVSNSIKD